jgi:flagellar biosynthesis/type III secretory pathway M-ring protein FliF/YscJ
VLEIIFQKFWTSYKSWSWWKKALGLILLVVLAILAALAIAAKILAPGPKTSADKEHAKTIDTALEGQEKIREELDETVNLKKKEMYRHINSASKIDAKTLKNRQRIFDATSMDELDELQKKLGL